jgi:hypothetical protein
MGPPAIMQRRRRRAAAYASKSSGRCCRGAFPSPATREEAAQRVRTDPSIRRESSRALAGRRLQRALPYYALTIEECRRITVVKGD